MLVMFVSWMLLKHSGLHSAHSSISGTHRRTSWYSDLVDVETVDLSRDEYAEGDEDRADDEERNIRMKGSKGYLWRLYYWIA